MRYSPLFMLLVLGVGCGGGGDAPAEETQEPAVEAEAPPAAEAPATSGSMDLPEGVTSDMVALGEAIFTGAGICYTCHMPGGVGGPLAPNLTDEEWVNNDGSYEAIVNTVTTGVPEPVEHPGIMLPKGGSPISDEEVRAVAAYVWTLNKGS
jgi:mono/diheme cytochrome c family protein